MQGIKDSVDLFQLRLVQVGYYGVAVKRNPGLIKDYTEIQTQFHFCLFGTAVPAILIDDPGYLPQAFFGEI
jgi:hypothetical protein